MVKNEKACSDGRTSKQAINVEIKADTSLHKDFNTWDGPISSLLSQGAEHGKTGRELSQITGFTRREIRRLVESERRRDGIPILSDTRNGYYMPQNEDEIISFIRIMHNNARELDKTADAVQFATGVEDGKS